MPDNPNPNADKDKNPYEELLARLDAQDAKIAELEKTNKEVTDFNKALLSRKGVTGGATDSEAAKAKLDLYLNEN